MRKRQRRRETGRQTVKQGEREKEIEIERESGGLEKKEEKGRYCKKDKVKVKG